MGELRCGPVCLRYDGQRGLVTGLWFEEGGQNFLISPELLERYGYEEHAGRLLGASSYALGRETRETGSLPLERCESGDGWVAFHRRTPEGLRFSHRFSLEGGRLRWEVQVENTGEKPLTLTTLSHWMPIGYVMHKTVEENLTASWSMVPSLGGSRPYVLCRVRGGEGLDLAVVNTTGKLKSVGSLCAYTNLFFEKTSPSLSGLVLFQAVNAWAVERPERVDWEYEELYRTLTLSPGERFSDEYLLCAAPPAELLETVALLGGTVADYPPVALCGENLPVEIVHGGELERWELYTADGDGPHLELRGGPESPRRLVLPPLKTPGERKLRLLLRDGGECCCIFPVYRSMGEKIREICTYIREQCFISDPEDPDYCGYRSVSPQGESCAKGSLLLLKNRLSPQHDLEEIRQAERNAVYFLRPHWLDENLIPLRKYPGGFARMADLDYLLLQFYLLSTFEDGELRLNTADTYLTWAAKLARYRLEPTPDKSERELTESQGPFFSIWNPKELTERLRIRGDGAEADRLETLLRENAARQKREAEGDRYAVTEHYYDNAGISTYVDYCLQNGLTQEGLRAARLLLPNVAYSTDYRCFAPDRWWEALAPMYHNLWAVYPAKAMLSAFEKGLDDRYLFAAYRAMTPLFYNYDADAVSARRVLRRGEGVSAYCLTAPNLNLEYASHNRFGQSVFTGPFFEKLDLRGEDWDMGLDVVLYLMSFGQSCYVTGREGRYLAVGGVLVENGNFVTVRSCAPFAGRYFLAPWGKVITRGENRFTIESVTLERGECVRCQVRGAVEPQEVVLWEECGGVRRTIAPEIQILAEEERV